MSKTKELTREKMLALIDREIHYYTIQGRDQLKPFPQLAAWKAIRRLIEQYSEWERLYAKILEHHTEQRPKVSRDTIRGSLAISITEMKKARFPNDVLDSLMADWREVFVRELGKNGVDMRGGK